MNSCSLTAWRRAVGLLVCLLVGAAVARAAVPAGRYCVSTDATVVLDRGTGLVWERGHDTGTWRQALARCGALSLGPYASGWRLPSLKELHTLVDEEADYGLDPEAFPGNGGDTPPFYWSSTPAAEEADHVWIVAFGGEKPSPTVGGLQNGQTWKLPLSEAGAERPHAVRCVR